MAKILKAGLAAGWIVLLAIFLERLREFFSFWPVAELTRLWPLLLSYVVESWFGYAVGVYLLLWLIGKWWMKYVWPWPSAPK